MSQARRTSKKALRKTPPSHKDKSRTSKHPSKGILAIAGKYKHMKPKFKIDIDYIRRYIDYSKA